MKPEARFKTRVRQILLEHHWDVQTIETATGRGVPDLSIAKKGVGNIWIELKYGDKEPQIRPEQNAWLTRRAMHGGKCGVVWSWDENENYHLQFYLSSGTTYRYFSPDLNEMLSGLK